MLTLKPVSYSVLGQLAFRPWSAYELIKEMKRNFHYFYPRAESGLYEELKKLEEAGLTTSKVKTKGKKERKVYTITRSGKKALKEWLTTEPESYWLEFDGLLRVFLSRFGNKEMLRNTLTKVKTDTDILLALAEKVGNEYLSEIAPAQSEIAQRAIIFDFLLHYGMMYKEWLIRTDKYLKETENISPKQAALKAKAVIRNSMKQFGFKTGAL